jgi:hypothetical protein
MIYAPPSREKSKQTMRSPLLDSKNVGGGGGNPSVNGPVQQFIGINSDEYMMVNGVYTGITNVGGAPVGTANGSKRVKQGAGGTVYGVGVQQQNNQQPIQITKAISNANSGGRGLAGDKYQSIHNSNLVNINGGMSGSNNS